jgi:nitronate monooxygenase
MILRSSAADVVYTPYFTGVHGNYLRPSIEAQGLDPDNLPPRDKTAMSFGSDTTKAWRDIWGVGQGIGSIDEILLVGDVVARLVSEYRAASEAICAQNY